MKRILWLVVPGLLGLSSLMTGNAASTCDHPYFPIRDGARWTYTSNIQGIKPTQYTRTIEQLSGDTFTMRQSFGEVSTDFRWKCGSQGLSSPEYGAVGGSNSQFKMEVVSFSGVMFPPASKWVVGSTWTAIYKIRAGTAKGQMSGDVNMTSKIVGEETVKVKAGSFRALKVTVTQKMNMTMTIQNRSTPMNNTLETTSWYARGVGLVKSSFQGGNSELIGYKL
jgi:hypothetical protein